MFAFKYPLLRVLMVYNSPILYATAIFAEWIAIKVDFFFTSSSSRTCSYYLYRFNAYST